VTEKLSRHYRDLVLIAFPTPEMSGLQAAEAFVILAPPTA